MGTFLFAYTEDDKLHGVERFPRLKRKNSHGNFPIHRSIRSYNFQYLFVFDSLHIHRIYNTFKDIFGCRFLRVVWSERSARRVSSMERGPPRDFGVERNLATSHVRGERSVAAPSRGYLDRVPL